MTLGSLFCLFCILVFCLSRTVIYHSTLAPLQLRSPQDLRRILTDNCERDYGPLASSGHLTSKRTPRPCIAPLEPTSRPSHFWTYRISVGFWRMALTPYSQSEFHPWICPIKDLGQHLHCHSDLRDTAAGPAGANHFPGKKLLRGGRKLSQLTCFPGPSAFPHLNYFLYRSLGKSNAMKTTHSRTHTHTPLPPQSFLFLLSLASSHYQLPPFPKLLFHLEQPTSPSPTHLLLMGPKELLLW